MVFTQAPRCQIVPLAGKQVAFGVDGRERLRWHYGSDSPRPFFFPLIGPSGLPLTRMGHPGAPDHDHHRSIWFAHHDVLGNSFWTDNSDCFIRQEQWLAYQDGESAAMMACQLRWYDGHDPKALVQQQLIVSLSPTDNDGLLFELQTSLVSVAESLELGKTNFGLLAVRMAKSLSAVFGDGVLTGANGQQTEKNLFGKPSPWIDYSGSIDTGVTEGITYFDHQQNLTYPSKWHVRQDGWMGASVCRDAPVMLKKSEPVVWRYLLHAHAGGVDAAIAKKIAADFNNSGPLRVGRSDKSHHRNAITRT